MFAMLINHCFLNIYLEDRTTTGEEEMYKIPLKR